MGANDRMLSVLTLFSVEQHEWTVEQAAEHLNIPVSTMYRYFASLNRIGLIAPTRSGCYVVGPAALQLDWLVRLNDPIGTAARAPLRALAERLDRPAVLLLCRLYRETVLCVDQMQVADPSFASSYERGRPMPLFRGASSRIILANLPARTLRSLHQRNAQEIAQAGLGATWDGFRRTLATFSRQRYCVSQGEVDPGLAAVAAPVVIDPDRRPLGSLSIVFSDDCPDEEEVRRLATMAQNAAAAIVNGAV